MNHEFVALSGSSSSFAMASVPRTLQLSHGRSWNSFSTGGRWGIGAIAFIETLNEPPWTMKPGIERWMNEPS